MTVTAELHDGRVLEFPDGTDPSVVQQTVKKVLGVPPAPAQNFAPPTGSLVDQIPIEQAPQQVQQPVAPQQPTAPRGMLQQAGDLIQRHVTGPIRNAAEAVIEPVATIASGFVAAPVAGIAGAAKEALGGNFGSGQAERTAQQVQEALTYQARNPNAQAVLSAAGSALDQSKLAGLPIVGQELPAIAQAAKQQMPLVRGAVGAAGEARAARIAARDEALATQSRAVAPRLDAIELAKKHNITLNPAEANPTKTNRIQTALTGNQDIDVHASRLNEQPFADMARKAIDLPEGSPLIKKVVEAKKAEAASMMNVAKVQEVVPADGKLFNDINGLIKGELIGGKAAQRKVMTLVSDAAEKASNGMNGEKILDNISQLRKEASSIYEMDHPGKKRLAIAKTSRGIADALEGMLERYIEKTSGEEAMATYRKGRELMAKIYVVEKASDLNTGKFDPAVVAKMRANGTRLTGELDDAAQIAGNFPDSSKVNAKVDWQRKHMIRSGPAGAAGAALGLAVGGPVGMGAGGLAGAATGEALGMANVNRILRPAYQKSNITPEDFRPLRERLGYSR